MFDLFLPEATASLRRFLQAALPTISTNWWSVCVLGKLTFRQKKDVERDSISSLSELDLASLLRVLDQNCSEISQKERLPREFRTLVKQMQDIRNRWAHAAGDGVPPKDLYRDLDTLHRFLSGLKADKNLLEKIDERMRACLTGELAAPMTLSDNRGLRTSPKTRNYEAYCRELIADLNASEPLLDYYIPNQVKEIPRSQESRSIPSAVRTVEDLRATLEPGHPLWITAPSGTGKTTLCIYLCRELAKRKLDNKDGLLPVFVRLRDYRKKGGLAELFRIAFTAFHFDTDKDREEFLEQGSFCWCFDGFNEAPNDERPDMFRDIEALAKRNPKSVIVVTTRPMDPREGFRFKTLQLEPFSDQQIAEYLNRRGEFELVDMRNATLPNDLLRSPLILSILVKVGREFKLDPQWNISELYRELAFELLRRELNKRNEQEQEDLYWVDLCEIARQLYEDKENLSYLEVPKAQAWQWILGQRGEFSVERGNKILATLIEATLLKEDPKRKIVEFIHPSFQSFFYAASILDKPMSDFEEFIGRRTSRVILLCDAEDPSCDHGLCSTSMSFREPLRFLFGLISKTNNAEKYGFFVDLMFQYDLLLAAACFDLFDRQDFLSRLRASLGFQDNSTRKGEYAFLQQVETLHSPILDETTWRSKIEPCVEFPEPETHIIAADEIAFHIIKKLNLGELAPRLLDHLCRTMQREQFPYVPSDSGCRGWGGDRFRELLELCSPEEIIEILYRILQEGTVYERQNAALVLNFHFLETFHRLPRECWDYLWDESEGIQEEPEVLDARPSYCDVSTNLMQIRRFVQMIPQEEMPATQVEGFLRALRIFESVFVIEPVTYLSEGQANLLEEANQHKQQDSAETLAETLTSWLTLHLIKYLLGDEHGQAQTYQETFKDFSDSSGLPSLIESVTELVIARFFEDWCRSKNHSDEESDFVKWAFFELRLFIKRLKGDLVRQMDDPLQQVEAAKAIVRLYIEELWDRSQPFWKRVTAEGCSETSFTEQRDGTTIRREIFKRSCAAFISACAISPLERGGPAAIEFLENELALEPNSEDFTKAARLLIHHFRTLGGL